MAKFLTSTIFLVVRTAVSHVQTSVITVTRLGVWAEDDVRAGGVKLHLAICVLPVTTLSCCPTTSVSSGHVSVGHVIIWVQKDEKYFSV